MSLSGNIRAGSAYVEVSAETSKLQRGLASAQAQLQAFGKSCTAIGRDMLMLSSAVAVPMAMAVKSFADFDDQMRLVRAVTKATTAEFESMSAVAAKLGRETSFTAKEVANGMVGLGRMGFSPKEVEQAILPVLDLARATGTDLGESADIAANAMRIFGIEASQMTDVADVLTATANGSAQTLTDLFEALKMAGPQAKAAGENIRDTSAAIGVLANLGIKGSLAGTALRKSYSQFAKVKVQDQLRAVGIEVLDANGNLRKMADIMTEIGKVMASMPSAEKIAFAEDIFDVRGSLAGLSLGGNADELDAFIKKLQNVKGTARDTAKEMDAGLGGSFRMLMSAVEGAMNAIGKSISKTLQPLVDKLTDVTLSVIGWIEANSGLVTAIAVTAAGAAALGVTLIVLGTAAKGVAAGITVVQTVLMGLAVVQSVCTAGFTTLKNSIMLLGTAFINYRNTAIPALVGTEQFCAALGLASTAANRTAASILMMSNAEAAAAAKSILAAKWQAMCNALNAFRTSAIAATIATKAQAAAEMAAGAKNALVAGWVAMTNAIKNFTLASAAATIATKAQAAAEMASAAKTAIIKGWVTLTNAMKSFTVASVAATVATKAQAVVEGACAIGTKVLAGARALAASVTALFSAANIKATATSVAGSAANIVLAISAKAVAAGYTLAAAAAATFCAIPVVWIVVALAAAVVGLCYWLAKSSEYTAKLSDEMENARKKGDELRKTDLARMERLKQLSEKQKLTTAEMAEAKELAGELQERYGDLGITISETTAKISAMGTAMSKIGSLELEIKNQDDLDKLQRLKALTLEVNLDVPRQDEAENIIADLSEKYGDLGMAVDRASGKIIRLNAVASALKNVSLNVSGTEDTAKIGRLQELSAAPKLDNSGLEEAQRLVSELTQKYGDLGITVDKTNGRIVAVTEEQKRFAEAVNLIQAGNDPMKETHLAQLERLQKLSAQEKLTSDEQREAESIVQSLNAAYKGLGLQVDSFTGKLSMASDAQKKLNKALQEATLAELDAEIAEMDANINELMRENDSLISYWNFNGWAYISGKHDKAMKKIDTNQDKMNVYSMKRGALLRRKTALKKNAEDQEALTGEKASEPTVQEKIEAEKQRRRQSADEAETAAKRAAEIEKKVARERKTALENEIDDIIALRDEYKSMIQTMLDYEKSKADALQDPKKIAELEAKLAGADKDAQARIDAAKKKESDKKAKEDAEKQQKLDEDVAGFQKGMDDRQKDIAQRRQDKAEERTVDRLLKDDRDVGLNQILSLITKYQQEADAARKQFDAELASAKSDGTIDDQERDRINAAQEAYERAESLVDKYQEKFRQANEGTQEAADKSASLGSYSSEVLDAMIGGTGDLQERTAKASELIAERTKESNRLLKKLGSGSSTTTYS